MQLQSKDFLSDCFNLQTQLRSDYTLLTVDFNLWNVEVVVTKEEHNQ
jgi:hypothetical protein